MDILLYTFTYVESPIFQEKFMLRNTCGRVKARAAERWVEWFPEKLIDWIKEDWVKTAKYKVHSAIIWAYRKVFVQLGIEYWYADIHASIYSLLYILLTLNIYMKNALLACIFQSS